MSAISPSAANANAAPRSDEIDLHELVLHLWGARYLIAAITALATSLAFIYTLITPPVYGARAEIAPSSLASYGALAAALQASDARSPTTIAAGRELASDLFAVLVDAIESPSNQRRYVERSGSSFTLNVDREDRHRKPTGEDPNLSKVTLEASGSNAEGVQASLDGYLRYAAALAADDVSRFLAGAGTPVEIEPELLYRLEQAPLISYQPIKPKRALIISLGLVLGLMAGTFIVLLRLTFARKQPT